MFVTRNKQSSANDPYPCIAMSSRTNPTLVHAELRGQASEVIGQHGL